MSSATSSSSLFRSQARSPSSNDPPWWFPAASMRLNGPTSWMAITSQLRPTPALGETWLRHWQAAGLLKPSAVKPVTATLEQRLVIKSLGVLHAEDEASLRQALRQIIA